MKTTKKGLMGFLFGIFSRAYASTTIPEPLYGIQPVEPWNIITGILAFITPIIGFITGMIVLLNKKLEKKAKIKRIVCILLIVIVLFCLFRKLSFFFENGGIMY